MRARQALLRDRHGPQRVTFMELFFDLVFVFAVTQLSHSLLEHLSWSGAIETLVLTWAVWGAWIYTAWITNWFDPNQPPVLLMILGLMFSGLVMAVVLPDAFDGRALAFVLAYLTTQVGRSLFCVWALRGHELQRNFVRVASWFVISAVPWIVGAMVDGNERTALWVLAMALETLAGFIGFYVPGLSYTRSAEWTISTEHFVERCQLFVIIALGESIIITGGTFSDGELTAKRTAAFVLAFLGAVAFWWIFYLKSIQVTPERSRERDAGGFARVISYTMVVVIAGIIVSAVGDELVIAHPMGRMETAWLVVIFGAPALFFVGMMLVQWVTLGTFTWWGLVALAALGVVALAMQEADPLAAAIGAFAVLLGVAAYDTVTTWGDLQRLLTAPVEVAEGAGAAAD